MTDMSRKNSKMQKIDYEIVEPAVELAEQQVSAEVTEPTVEKIDILTDESVSEARERETDFLRSRLHDMMGLKVTAPTDEILVGEVAQRITRLMKLEEDLEMIAQAFNCPKDEVIANTIENVKIYAKMEKAEKELEKERENFLREVKNLDDENQRLLTGVETLRQQIEAQTEAIEKVREENKRISFWEKIFGAKENGEGNGGESE